MKNAIVIIIVIATVITITINPFVGNTILLSIIAYLVIRYRAYYYVVKANRRYDAGEKEEALKFYKKAAKMRMSPTKVKIMYGFLLLKTGHLDEADKELTALMKGKLTNEEKWKAKLYYAIVVWKKGDLNKAIELLEEVHENYRCTLVYQTLGLLLNLSGKLQNAIKYNKEAYDYNDDDSLILDNLGQNYYLLNQNDKAYEIYKKLFEKEPKFPEAYYNYALVLLKNGQKEEAIEKLNQALKQNFTFLTTVSKEDIKAKLKELV